MNRTTQTTTRAAQGLKSERQTTAPATEHEKKVMLSVGLDPRSHKALKEFRVHFKQLASESAGPGL